MNERKWWTCPIRAKHHSGRLCICWTPPATCICCRPHGLWKVLQSSATPHWAILGYQHWAECAEINQDGKQNTVSINKLTRLAKVAEGRIHVRIKEEQWMHPIQEASIEYEKNIYGVRKTFRHEDRPTETYHTFNGTDTDLWTTGSSPPSSFPNVPEGILTNTTKTSTIAYIYKEGKILKWEKISI